MKQQKILEPDTNNEKEDFKSDLKDTNWQRVSASSMKENIVNWLDYNFEYEITSETLIESQESDDRLYFKISEEVNSDDEDPRFQNSYFCMFQKFESNSIEEVEL